MRPPGSVAMLEAGHRLQATGHGPQLQAAARSSPDVNGRLLFAVSWLFSDGENLRALIGERNYATVWLMAARDDISDSRDRNQNTTRLQREVSPDDEPVKPVGVSDSTKLWTVSRPSC